MKPLVASTSLALLLLGLACGGGGGGRNEPVAPSGQLTLFLGADSQKDWGLMSVGIDRVEVSSNGSTWMTVASPGSTLIDLTTLQNGHEKTLATRTEVPAGTYAVRIVWNSTAVAQTAGDATLRALQMPSASTLLGTLTVHSSAESKGYLMIDAARAIQTFDNGTATAYVFQPHPQVLDAAQCGEITGKVLANAAPLAGQEVLAQIVDGHGLPTIQRRALTEADGTFRLRPLQANQGSLTLQYLIVCLAQPSTTTAYPAQGIGPVALTAGSATTGQDLLFTGTPVSTGGLQASFTAPSAKGVPTLADLRQFVLFGAATQYVIVQEGTANRGPASDVRLFPNLPDGFYGVNGTRLSSPVETVTAPSQTVVSAGATATVDLAFP